MEEGFHIRNPIPILFTLTYRYFRCQSCRETSYMTTLNEVLSVSLTNFNYPSPFCSLKYTFTTECIFKTSLQGSGKGFALHSTIALVLLWRYGFRVFFNVSLVSEDNPPTASKAVT